MASQRVVRKWSFRVKIEQGTFVALPSSKFQFPPGAIHNDAADAEISTFMQKVVRGLTFNTKEKGRTYVSVLPMTEAAAE